MEIIISAQHGSSYSSRYFTLLYRKLNEVFEKHISRTYFKSIEKFSVIFRVSGKIHDFGSEGPELMKYLRKRHIITIDLTFPESSWKWVHPYTVHEKIIKGVEECIRIMTERAIKEKEVTNLENFQKDVKKALDECMDPTKFDYGTLVEKYSTIPYK